MTKKTTMDTPSAPEPKPRKKKIDAKASSPEKKELTAYDVLEMMNAARKQADDERQARFDQRQLEREERKQRLYELLDALVHLEPSDTQAALGVTKRDILFSRPLSQDILGDAFNRFTYRNGRAFILFEGAMVPAARKQAMRFAHELGEAAAQNADNRWSTSLKPSLQKTLANQATAERIELPHSVEAGLSEITRSVDAISHLRTMQRLLEERKEWQPRREPLQPSSKSVSVSEIITREETDNDGADSEEAWQDAPLDKEYVEAQQQAFERTQKRVRSQISQIEDRDLRSACEKQLDLFVQSVDKSRYIEYQIDDAHNAFITGEQIAVLDDATYTLLQNAFDDEMYGKIDEAKTP